MSDEQQQVQQPEEGAAVQDEQPHEATCPKCGHHFWHKIGEALKTVGETAIDVGLNIVEPGVPK